MTTILAKFFSFLISFLLIMTNLFGLNGRGDTIMNKNGSLACVDSLGREIVSSGSTSKKKVGIFYFLWQGVHGTGGPYDNSKIVANNPDAILSEANWIASGGGGIGEHHFWGEPLFGYYTSKDSWVMRKHLQMLTDAGVDFIVLDATNGITYADRVKDLIEIWYEYLIAGWDVPQIACYTNSSSGDTMNRVYDELYNNAELNSKYPRLNELWFKWDGKPMIVGQPEDAVLREDVKAYFRIKASQWPTEERKADGFPWMEFDRLLTYNAVYGEGIKREIMSVSAAQHSDTCRFSATAWYGANDRNRTWHNGANDASPNSVMYGYNFAEQWNFAMSFDPDIVFVTGFNEWVAQRQPGITGEPIVFVDCADMTNSRDVEPMNGLLGDNYYMQLVDYIAKFKGTVVQKQLKKDLTIDFNGSFEQWNSPNAAVYEDYTNDIVDRNCSGFGDLRYIDVSGRNDIKTVKAAKDSQYLYFYVDTVNTLTSAEDDSWMNLLLRVDSNNPNINGYDFLLNRNRSGNKATVEKYIGSGFINVGNADIITDNNKIMLSIDKNLLGLQAKKAYIQFKWTDNCDLNDIYSFYKSGDSAPYGRLNYTFAE
ncbi:MAG: hypothetical protein WCN92_01765 [Eubacteriales bacterium]